MKKTPKDHVLVDATRLAVKFCWDLHGNAGENVDSSLITAALNENERFRHWLVKKANLETELRFETAVGEANEPLPKFLIDSQADLRSRQAGRKPGRKIPSRMYRRPDITVRDGGATLVWKRLRDNVAEFPESAASLVAVFIETKWRWLTSEECDRYERFLDTIEGKSLANCRFLFISSLPTTVVERLRGVSRPSRDEMPMWMLLQHRSVDDGTLKVVTYGEVLGALQDSLGAEQSPSSYPATTFARECLRIAEHEEPIEYWCYTCGIAGRSGDRAAVLREAIVVTAIGILARHGFISREFEPPGVDKKNVLEFGDSPLEVRMSHRGGGAEMKHLSILIGRHELQFDLDTISAEEIWDRLEKLRQIAGDQVRNGGDHA